MKYVAKANSNHLIAIANGVDFMFFINRMSCVTQLLHVMEHWTKISDDGNDVDIIYLDFRKAFDCVPHQRLLSKLKAYGI